MIAVLPVSSDSEDYNAMLLEAEYAHVLLY